MNPSLGLMSLHRAGCIIVSSSAVYNLAFEISQLLILGRSPRETGRFIVGFLYIFKTVHIIVMIHINYCSPTNYSQSVGFVYTMVCTIIDTRDNILYDIQ